MNTLTAAALDKLTRQARASAPFLEKEIHIWHALASEEAVRDGALESLLTLAERRRAEVYRSPVDRASFIMRRAMLRGILAGYVGCPAGELMFIRNRFGKPRLAQVNLEFSLSKSSHGILIGISKTRRIGVDLQFPNADFDFQAVAAYYLAPAEYKDVAALRPTEARRAFFSYWTRKEAFVKALGCGCSMPLNSFQVPRTAAAPVVVLRSNEREELHDWQIADLSLVSPFQAALAAEGREPLALRYMWPELAAVTNNNH